MHTMHTMHAIIAIILATLLAACGAEPIDTTSEPADAGASDITDPSDLSDAGELDATTAPDAEPTCVAYVDACHVRACPSGVVTTRPDGATCPAALCPTHDVGTRCACRDGVCAWSE